MIITVTLNPALDKTVEINNFAAGHVNRISSVRVDAGGKGINVSKVVKSLGGNSVATGLLAGDAGGFIKAYLDREGIDNDFVFLDGETRTNMKIIDRENKENTDINEQGPIVSEADLAALEQKLFSHVKAGDIVVLSGSLPKDAPRDIYGKWIKRIKALGAKAILDADGDVLVAGIEAGPCLAKPNIHELEKILGMKIENREAAVQHARQLLQNGIDTIAVSLGGDGALFVDKRNAIYAKGLQVPVASTVGAGDSMVAAQAYAMDKGMEAEDAIILSVATSAANVTTSGTQPAEYGIIEKLMKKVEIQYIS